MEFICKPFTSTWFFFFSSSISLDAIHSRAKHSKMSVALKVCVELPCTHCMWKKNLNAGQRKAIEKEVGWLFLKPLNAADMRGCGWHLKKASLNGTQMVWSVHCQRRIYPISRPTSDFCRTSSMVTVQSPFVPISILYCISFQWLEIVIKVQIVLFLGIYVLDHFAFHLYLTHQVEKN